MLRIGIVGDLSQRDPTNLARALDCAMAASDVVVQLGDINPGYAELSARLASGKVLPVRGNHDNAGPGNWDASLPGVAKTWRKDYPEAVLIGLDNSPENGTFTPESWATLDAYDKAGPDARHVFLFAHKALSPLVLTDGNESTHIMGEGGPSADADKLKAWMRAHGNTTIACGHYHGSSVMRTSYGVVILEGRGGAQGYQGADVVGYTVVHVQPEGWTAHAFTI